MHLSRTRLVGGLAAATLPLALLTGCSEDDPQPRFEEPTSEPPSTSRTPEEPTKPTRPAAMKGDDVEAAKAFVKYYFDRLSYAVLSGDMAGMESLAMPDCGGCNGALNAVRAIYRSGGTVRGGEMVASNVRVAEKPTGVTTFNAFGGKLRLSISDQVIRGTGNTSLDGRSDSSTISVQIQLVHSSSGWQVAEWSQL